MQEGHYCEIVCHQLSVTALTRSVNACGRSLEMSGVKARLLGQLTRFWLVESPLFFLQVSATSFIVGLNLFVYSSKQVSSVYPFTVCNWDWIVIYRHTLQEPSVQLLWLYMSPATFSCIISCTTTRRCLTWRVALICWNGGMFFETSSFLLASQCEQH